MSEIINSHPTFIALDLETTGLAYTSRIVEIGMLKFCGEKILATYNTLVNPLCEIPQRVIAIHGITNYDVRNAPTFEDIIDEVLEFISGGVIIAHNANYDVNILANELHRNFCGVNYIYALDTLRIAQKCFEFDRYSLEHIAKEFGFATEGMHRALKDAELVYKIFNKFCEEIGDELPQILKIQGGNILPALPQDIELIDLVKSRNEIMISYTTSDGHSTTRKIKLFDIFERFDRLYLWAYCYLKDDYRTFRLDRMETLDC